MLICAVDDEPQDGEHRSERDRQDLTFEERQALRDEDAAERDTGKKKAGKSTSSPKVLSTLAPSPGGKKASSTKPANALLKPTPKKINPLKTKPKTLEMPVKRFKLDFDPTASAGNGGTAGLTSVLKSDASSTAATAGKKGKSKSKKTAGPNAPAAVPQEVSVIDLTGDDADEKPPSSLRSEAKPSSPEKLLSE